MSAERKMYKPITSGKERAMLLNMLQQEDNEDNAAYESCEEEQSEPPRKRQAFRAAKDYAIQSYQLHTDLKDEIADVLQLIRQESKKQPNAHHQVRNRTAASITKRYLYERDRDRLVRCLQDSNRLLEKYRGKH